MKTNEDIVRETAKFPDNCVISEFICQFLFVFQIFNITKPSRLLTSTCQTTYKFIVFPSHPYYLIYPDNQIHPLKISKLPSHSKALNYFHLPHTVLTTGLSHIPVRARVRIRKAVRTIAGGRCREGKK